ncbi:MAG: phospho-N-acetylmuramoyl-pentapeptide-transferase [Bacilli bacterium]|nr:phospho-N-acetylmuramoyl-pentapeptide-transferase [Bacilli bacterium]
MIILIKSVMSIMIGFIFSGLLGLMIVPFFKKRQFNQVLNRFLEKEHKEKVGTPTMGGLIFIIPSFLITLILIVFNKIKLYDSLIIIMFTFISYAIIGFIDDFLIIKKQNNKGLSKNQKLIMQVIIAIVFFYLFMKTGNEPLIWIHTLKIRKNIGWLYGLFILFILTASSNAVNLTDGLDGLAGGLSLISFITFGILSWNADWLLGYEEIAIFAFILVGSLLGFMIFNVNKAKIFMGDIGSLALGATLGAYAIITRHELLLILIGIVFIIETVSCIIQLIVYKYTKKRVFLMTPIHHTFEKLGWNEQDIVKLFWIIGLIASMIAIIWGVIL